MRWSCGRFLRRTELNALADIGSGGHRSLTPPIKYSFSTSFSIVRNSRLRGCSRRPCRTYAKIRSGMPGPATARRGDRPRRARRARWVSATGASDRRIGPGLERLVTGRSVARGRPARNPTCDRTAGLAELPRVRQPTGCSSDRLGHDSVARDQPSVHISGRHVGLASRLFVRPARCPLTRQRREPHHVAAPTLPNAV